MFQTKLYGFEEDIRWYR